MAPTQKSFLQAGQPKRKPRLLLRSMIATALLAIWIGAVRAGDIAVENPSIRFIIKARPAAGYFRLRNATSSVLELIGASSPACGMLTLHQSKEENGVAKMVPVASLKVPPDGSLVFRPGGYHLMCMQPRNLNIGAQVPITLRFADGKTMTIKFPVTGPGGK